VNISVTVCLFVCTVTDFSAEDKASGVKFCRAVHRRPGQGISHFCELCSPRSSQSDESASAWRTMNVPVGDSTSLRGLLTLDRHVWIHVSLKDGRTCLYSVWLLEKTKTIQKETRHGHRHPAAVSKHEDWTVLSFLSSKFFYFIFSLFFRFWAVC